MLTTIISFAIMYTVYMSGVLTHIIFDMDASLNKRISSRTIATHIIDMDASLNKRIFVIITNNRTHIIVDMDASLNKRISGTIALAGIEKDSCRDTDRPS